MDQFHGQFLKFYIAIGILFGVFAGSMAYLITYIEFVKHSTLKENPGKIAMQAGAATFVFFLVLSILAGIFLPKFII